MKGHKKSCKCVGCSSATRRAGMAALKKYQRAKPGTAFKKAPKALRKKIAQAIKARRAKPNPKPKDIALAIASNMTLAHAKRFAQSLKTKGWYVEKPKRQANGKYRVEYATPGLVNPLTRKGRRIKRAMEKFYDKLKGKRVFYASAKTGAITKVDRRRKHRNRPKYGPFIGSNVTLRMDTGRRLYFGGSSIRGGKDNFTAVILSAPHSPNLVHHQVRAVEYDNKAKALRAYGKPGRFIHTFKSPVTAKHGGAGIIVLKSPSRIWRTS